MHQRLITTPISTLITEDLKKSFGIGKDRKVLFDHVNMDIKRGEKICIVGRNGIGKTTLLKIIMNQLAPDSGRVKIGHNVTFGYYDQGQMLLDPNNTVLGEMKETYRLYTDTKMRSVLGRFLFRGDDVFLKVSDLSGGEKARLSLLKMMLGGANTLLLDEPTNHLDNQGRNRLYEWVKKCRSTLIVVSHDRTLLNRLPETCELSRNALVCYGGNYEFYKQQKELQQNALQQQLDEKEKELRQIRKLAREVAERKEKQNIRSEKSVPKKGISRMAVHTLKDRAEKSTTKLADIHQNKSEKLTSERSLIRNRLAENALLKTDFHASALHTGKTLLAAHEINFSYGNSPLWEVPLCFQLKSGDRIRIEGDNGSGKTTLLKLVTGDLLPTSGTLERAGFSYVYLNQEYSIICNQLTVLQQAESFNVRALPEHEIKIRLNRFLFPATSWCLYK